MTLEFYTVRLKLASSTLYLIETTNVAGYSNAKRLARSYARLDKSLLLGDPHVAVVTDSKGKELYLELHADVAAKL